MSATRSTSPSRSFGTMMCARVAIVLPVSDYTKIEHPVDAFSVRYSNSSSCSVQMGTSQAIARGPFLLSTTVDFPDDCRSIVFTEGLLAELFDVLPGLGVRRVYWNYYGPPGPGADHGLWDAFCRTQ